MDCVVFLKYLFPIRLSRIAQWICMKFEVKIKAMLYPTVLIVSMESFPDSQRNRKFSIPQTGFKQTS